MFGLGKKNETYDVRLTEKQIKELEKNMSRGELEEFRKRQQQAESNRFWDVMMLAELLDD